MNEREIGSRRMLRTALRIVLVLVLFYLALGAGFHVLWEGAQADCRAEREARGEFVEPPVFSNAVRFAFDAAFWPVYARANLRLSGDLFSTPCSHD